MKQITRLTMTLALLIMAVTGAWAQNDEPTVTWDPATKTGTFTQPAGNVTVSVEYYDLATLASQGLTAAEDAAAKTEAPLAVLAENAVTGGTLMYAIGTETTYPDLDGSDWSAAIPTAENLNPAGGTYYVWYYIKGDDEHSDTAPQCLAVTVLPEPTYNVEFAEGIPEPDKWSASPNTGVKKGQTVTVTYTGTKKVIGVKAEKKKAEKTITIGEQNYTVLDGETWSQFITRNQLSSWSIKSANLNTYCVSMDGGSAMFTLFVSSDGNNWEPFEFSPQDAPIDTDKQYII